MTRSPFDLETHTSLFGQTSSGKTWFFREAIWKKSKKAVIFVNTQREAGFGPEVRTWDPKMLRTGARINLVGPTLSASDDGQAQLRALIVRVLNDLFRVGEKLAGSSQERIPGWVIMAVDEAHLFAPKQGWGPLPMVATNGNRYGIKGFWITQRPAVFSQTCISQSTRILFKLNDAEKGYLDEYAVPLDVQEWVRKPRCFALQRPSDDGWTTYRPI